MRRRAHKDARKSNAKTIRPPTTPPAIAPTSEDFLWTATAVPVVAIDEVVRLVNGVLVVLVVEGVTPGVRDAEDESAYASA